ncbi:MAG: Trm112 family protein [Actinomycetes bacterium]|jgi:uncharacterized protein YbaR (Trm112 family)|nr:MAG: hypothetical protein DIU67_01520 [Actinomycetota bacterium]
MSLIDPLLAGILVCAADHGRLEEDSAGSRLICAACGRSYPVRDGIPVMILDEERGDE